MARDLWKRLRTANERLLEAGELEGVDELFTPDYVLHTDGKDFSGQAFVRRFVRKLRAALPDLRVEELVCLQRKGDTLVWQRRLCGRHTADLHGIPPSGKMVRWSELFVSRFEGLRIAEEWAASELAGKLLLQLPRPKTNTAGDS